MQKLLYSIFFVLLASAATSQQRNITGSVTDVTNNPISGATVTQKGMQLATQTDVNGKFSINVSPASNILVVSFVGFNSQEISIADRNEISVRLVPSATNLSDVIVTGYKTERKRDLTGAVSVVNMAEIKNIPASNPLLTIQGRVPGLYIEQDGSPTGGSRRVLIRGLNTLGNTDPLYVIDGVPTKGPHVFASLNPGSIASVQVLKDASAASIYGARASNGVIIVTTKNGRGPVGTSKTTIQFNSSITAQTVAPSFEDVLTSEERGRVLWRASVNDRTDPAVHSAIYTYDWNGDYDNPVLNSVTIQPYVNNDPTEPAGNTNWQKELYKTALVYQNDLTLSNGNDKNGLLLNLGYFKSTGTMEYTNFERISTRLNAFTSFFNDKVKVGENVMISRTKQRLQARDLGGAATPGLAVILAPTIPVYKTDGSFAGPAGAGYTDRNNPVNMQYQNRWDNTTLVNIFGNVYLEAALARNLLFRTSYGGDYNTSEFKDFELAFQEGFLGRTVNSLAINQQQTLSRTWTNTLTYSIQSGGIRLDLLAGTEAVRQDIKLFGAFREGFVTQDFNYFSLDAGIGRSGNNGSETGNRLFSAFGKAFFSYQDRYLASLTVRRDGSSRFGTNNRYGTFPAGTIGWRVSNENFFKPVEFISDLKLRAGFGIVGNQEIGDLASLGLLRPNYGTLLNNGVGFPGAWVNVGTAYDLNGANGGTLPSGYVQVQAGNPNLRWESTRELNVGIDFGLLDNKLVGSFDVFSRTTKDILIQPPIASAIGEGRLKWVNGATIENKGWEVMLTYQNTAGKLRYAITGNAAHFADKITELPEEVRTAYPGNVEKTILGHSRLSFFGYKVVGIFQTQDAVDKSADQPGKGVGRFQFADLNSDGVIDALDQDWLGTMLPSVEYGITIDLDYNHFDLSVFGSGVAGKKGGDPVKGFNSFAAPGWNNGPKVLQAWTPQNTGSNIPALSLANTNAEERSSNYTIVNASYFRLRNIQLGYTLSRPSFSKIGLQSLRFYIVGQNLFVLKSKDFWSKDPERTEGDQYWPMATGGTLGINVTF